MSTRIRKARRILTTPMTLRYLVIGVGAYFIEMSFLYALKRAGMNNVEAVAISFWVSLITTFILQKFITFRDVARSRKHLTRQVILYLLLVLFNYTFTLLIVAGIGQKISVFIARTLTIICTTVWNYYFYKTHIFSDYKKAKDGLNS